MDNTSTLSISKNSNFGTIFDASFAKINCGAACLNDTKTYVNGLTIMLLAIPNSGYAVNSWNNCPNQVAPDQCLISSLNNDSSISVNFVEYISSVPCTVQDAIANGVDLTNSTSTIAGLKDGSNITSCLLAANSCNPYYKNALNNKSCSAKLAAELTAGELISLGYNTTGGILSGTYPNLTLTCTSSFQQLAVDSKSCIDKDPVGSFAFVQDYTKTLNANNSTLSYTDAQQVQFYSDGTCTNTLGSVINLPVPSVNITVPSGEGVKNISAKFINGSKMSSCATDSIILDQTAPAITLSVPANTYSNGSTFSVSGICEANTLITFTEATKTQTTTCSGSGTYSYTYEPSLISSDGNTTVIASQTDLAGNIGSANSSYIVDKTPPVTNISNDDITNSSFESPIFTISASDANIQNMTMSLGLNENDTSITSLKAVSIGTTSFQSSIANGYLTANLAPGKTYYATFKVYDKAGNVTTKVSIPWFYGIVPIKAKNIELSSVSACAHLLDDTVKCWGYNGAGALGQNYASTFQLSTPPETVLNFGGASVKKLKAGSSSFCVITSNDDLYCWGGSASGELGLGNTLSKFGTNLVNVGAGLKVKDLDMSAGVTCVILNDNSSKCWGSNTNNQLGYGDTTNRGGTSGTTPDQIPALNFGSGLYAKQISCHTAHTCAILSNDTVRCWGVNSAGNLGLGHTNIVPTTTTAEQVPPVLLNAPGKIPVKLATGPGSNSCVIFNDNSVKCWGANQSFTLTGSAGAQSTPIAMDFGGVGVKDISLTRPRICVDFVNDTSKCWGENPYGELGLGYNSPIAPTAKRYSETSAINLGTGLIISKTVNGEITNSNTDSFTCAITITDLVKCWGENLYGRLGAGDNEDKGTSASTFGDNLPPIRTRPNLTITEQNSYFNTTNFILNGYCVPNKLITFSETNSRNGVTKNQTTMCAAGGTFSYTYIPDATVASGDVFKIYVSQDTDYGDTGLFSAYYLVDRDAPTGTITGNSITTDPNYPPMMTIQGFDFSFTGNKHFQVFIGTSVGNNSLYQSSSRAIYTGSIFYQEGFWSGVFTTQPFDFGSATVYSQVDAKFGPSRKNVTDAGIPMTSNLANIQPNTPYYTTVVFTDNLGFTTTVSKEWQYVPGYLPLSKDKAPAALGANHGCHIEEATSRPSCWGTNTNGQMGLGHINATTGTRAVTGTTNWIGKSIAAGSNHTCIIIDDTSDAFGDIIKCWGVNSSGQLGNNSTTQATSPVTVSLNTSYIPKSIYAGGDTTCSIIYDGINNQLYCWGNNANGELGIGSTINKTTPQLVNLGADIPKMVSVGNNHVCVILENNSVKCWGKNDQGQLGDGTNANKGHTAATTPDLLPYVALGNNAGVIATGFDHTCVILPNNAMKCWGGNASGQLGLSKTTLSYNTPQLITVPGQVPKYVSANGKHTCILTVKNDVECLGLNTNGELGLGTSVADKDAFTGSGVISYGANGQYLLPKYVVTGENNTCAIMVGQRMKCWGKNLANNQTTPIGLTATSMDATNWGQFIGVAIKFLGDELP